MQRILFFLILLIIPVGYSPFNSESRAFEPGECNRLYTDMGLGGIVDYDAFEQAVAGYRTIEGRRKDIITLIDFSKPSTEERLYVLDVKQKKMLFCCHVAHGQGSGGNFASSFSNVSGSHQSSLGFYLTSGTYQGRNGYSLLLDGLEKGINDKARERAIVIHGAAYANPSVIAGAGRLGRSFGCPALPEALNAEIINTIKEGSVLFIYAADSTYSERSEILAAM